MTELSLASSLAGSGWVGCFGASVIPLASKRQIFGGQAERNTAVIGAGRIEIERDMRIDRVPIAKLPLQCSRREQPPRAARSKQQRHRFRAEFDGIDPVAAQAGLGCE